MAHLDETDRAIIAHLQSVCRCFFHVLGEGL